MRRTFLFLLFVCLTISAPPAQSLRPADGEAPDRDALLLALMRVQEGIDWDLKYTLTHLSAGRDLLARQSVEIGDALTGGEPADLVRPWDLVEFKDLIVALADSGQPLLIYWNTPKTHLVVTTAAERKGDGRYWLLAPGWNFQIDCYTEIQAGRFVRIAKVYGQHEIRHRLHGMPGLIVETNFTPAGQKTYQRICSVTRATPNPVLPGN